MKHKAVDILIVDDDPVAGQLAKDLLAEAGFSVHLSKKSLEALPEIRQRKPKLLLLDATLTGLNGLQLCKMIASSQEFAGLKIAVLSQKYYEAEKQQAFKSGACAFIRKPYNVETFASQINHILTGSQEEIAEIHRKLEEPMPQPSTEQPDLNEGEVRLTFWGCRSTPETLSNGESAYGRQTACVSVEAGDQIIVLDAGTGIIPLGNWLLETNRHREMWVILTHLHLGHIMGLPNFPCAYAPGYTLKIAGPAGADRKFKDTVRDLFYGSQLWDARRPKAKMSIYDIAQDSYDLAKGIKLHAMHARHPSPTLCLRLDVFGKKIVYAPSSEITGDLTALENYEEELAVFAADADLFIHDAYYTEEDYKLHAGKGHSSASRMLEFAASEAQAKEAVLFNLNSSYSDETIEILSRKADRLVEETGMNIACRTAKEGLKIII